MNIMSLINNKLEDEGKDSEVYKEASEVIKSDTSISEEDRELISSVFMRLSMDEASHNILLKSIKGVIGGEGNE